MTSSRNDMGIDRLTVQERLDLIALIWGSIAEKPEVPLMPEWHREELDRRLANAAAEPADGITWEDVMVRLRKPS